MQHFHCSEEQKYCTVCRKLTQSADSTALLPLQLAKVHCLHFASVFCTQYSTFAPLSSKSVVLSAENCLKVQTVHHFRCSEGQKCCTVCKKLQLEWQKCCTVCTLRQFSADSTALLLPQNAKVLYCLHFEAVLCRQYSTFATLIGKSAVLSTENCMHAQTVQHFCYPKKQKCCTVCTKSPKSYSYYILVIFLLSGFTPIWSRRSKSMLF